MNKIWEGLTKKWVFLALNVTAAFAMAVLLILIARKQDHLQATIDKGFQIIQRERAATIVYFCRNNNDHHDAARVALTELLPAANGKTLTEAQAKAINDFLNDAIPKHNCAALVRLTVPKKPQP